MLQIDKLSRNCNLVSAELVILSSGEKTHFDFQYFDVENFEHSTDIRTFVLAYSYIEYNNKSTVFA